MIHPDFLSVLAAGSGSCAIRDTLLRRLPHCSDMASIMMAPADSVVN
jgi:hypothetical protein